MNRKIFTLLIAFILSVSAGFAQTTLQLQSLTNATYGTVEVKLNMSGFTQNIGAASINIAINTELLEYAGGNMAFNGGTILANTVKGELKLSWFNAMGANANGTFATLLFNYAGALPTNLVFNQTTTQIANVDGNLIPVIVFTNGSITPTTATVGKIALADIEVASVGSNLQMPLTATALHSAVDFTQVTAFQFEMSYDPDKLYYAGIADNALGMRVSSSPGLIELSWADIGSANLANNYLLSHLNFKYLGGGVASLNFKSGFVSTGTNFNPVAIELVGGSVRVNPGGAIQGVLTLPEVYAPANSAVSVPLNVAGVSAPVSIINLNLSYDAKKLTYTGYTANQLSGWSVNVNQGNGTINAIYTNATAQTIADGSLLSFNFNYTSGKAILAFASGTVMQTSATNYLNLELNDGFVNSRIMINALANNAGYGLVEGGGEFVYNASVSLTATANAGYSFVNWTEEGNQVSTNANYQFAATTSRDLVANFTAESYALTLTASPAIGGVLTGAGNYDFGASVSLTATAAEGYSFVNWTNSEGEVSAVANFNYTMPAAASTLTANFTAIAYTLTLVSSPEGAGVLTGSGDCTAGTEVAITATANAGFQFVNWTDSEGEVSAVANFNYTMPAEASTLTANYRAVYSISGKVKYANTTGAVRPINTNATTTTQVILFASNGTTEITRVNTDINGDYSFTNIPVGNYVVSAETDKPWGAIDVTLADYAIIRGFVNNSIPIIDGLRFLAADVNTSGDLTLLDYAVIRNFVNTSTKSPAWTATDWIFQTLDSTITDENIIENDISGVSSGDANASHTPPL